MFQFYYPGPINLNNEDGPAAQLGVAVVDGPQIWATPQSVCACCSDQIIDNYPKICPGMCAYDICVDCVGNWEASCADEGFEPHCPHCMRTWPEGATDIISAALAARQAAGARAAVAHPVPNNIIPLPILQPGVLDAIDLTPDWGYFMFSHRVSNPFPN